MLILLVRDELHRAGATPRAQTVSKRSVSLPVMDIYATLGTVRGGRPDPLQRPFGTVPAAALEIARFSP